MTPERPRAFVRARSREVRTLDPLSARLLLILLQASCT